MLRKIKKECNDRTRGNDFKEGLFKLDTKKKSFPVSGEAQEDDDQKSCGCS